MNRLPSVINKMNNASLQLQNYKSSADIPLLSWQYVSFHKSFVHFSTLFYVCPIYCVYFPIMSLCIIATSMRILNRLLGQFLPILH